MLLEMLSSFDCKKFRQELIAQGFISYQDFAGELQKRLPTASRQLVHQWIEGHQEPSVKYIRLICKILKVKQSYFDK